jgi:ankyrin repeat protein
MSKLGNPKAVEEFIDAAVGDHPKALQLLRANPDLLEAEYLHSETPMHFLAVEGYLEGVRWLLDQGGNVNSKNAFGGTALSEAAQLRNLPMVRLLLSRGADPNVNPTVGPPLSLAIAKGDIEMATLLLEAGARLLEGESEVDSVAASLERCSTKRAEMEELLRRFNVHGGETGP